MKKKGLIISTAVMVVVLIASLTTATYAWFSKTASVSVQDMTLQTVAAEGLQISVKSGEDNYSEELSMDAGKLVGTGLDWGSTLTFTNPGATQHATTHIVWTEVAADSLTTWAPNTDYYTLAADVYTLVDQSTVATPAAGIVYYTAALNSDDANAKMYVPTEYNEDSKPLGYKEAVNLTNYFSLPIQIRATSNNVSQIYYRIKVVPVKGDMNANFYPGMAAASRINITPTADITGSTVADLTPFSAAHLQGTAILNDANAKYQETDTYSMDGFIMNYPADTQEANYPAAYTAYDFNIEVWIEGTDLECINETAGSGFNILIEFGYTTFGAPQATLTDGVLTGVEFQDEQIKDAGTIHEVVA